MSTRMANRCHRGADDRASKQPLGRQVRAPAQRPELGPHHIGGEPAHAGGGVEAAIGAGRYAAGRRSRALPAPAGRRSPRDARRSWSVVSMTPTMSGWSAASGTSLKTSISWAWRGLAKGSMKAPTLARRMAAGSRAGARRGRAGPRSCPSTRAAARARAGCRQAPVDLADHAARRRRRTRRPGVRVGGWRSSARSGASICSMKPARRRLVFDAAAHRRAPRGSRPKRRSARSSWSWRRCRARARS